MRVPAFQVVTLGFRWASGGFRGLPGGVSGDTRPIMVLGTPYWIEMGQVGPGATFGRRPIQRLPERLPGTHAILFGPIVAVGKLADAGGWLKTLGAAGGSLRVAGRRLVGAFSGGGPAGRGKVRADVGRVRTRGAVIPPAQFRIVLRRPVSSAWSVRARVRRRRPSLAGRGQAVRASACPA